MGLALFNWNFLAELLSSEDAAPLFPTYLAVTGFTWGVVGLPLIWSIWRGKHRAPYFLLAVMLAYSVYFWTDRLFIPGYPLRNSDWPFAVSLNLLILFGSLWIITRRNVREFFGEAHG
jgi:hypothetical protein